MGLPTMMAVKAFFKSAWPFMLAIGVALILLLTYCEGRKSGTNARDLQRERGNTKSLEEKAKADERAGERRRDDDARLSTEDRELEGVRNEHRKSSIDRRLVRHRCLRAQQQARAANRPAPSCD